MSGKKFCEATATLEPFLQGTAATYVDMYWKIWNFWEDDVFVNRGDVRIFFFAVVLIAKTKKSYR